MHQIHSLPKEQETGHKKPAPQPLDEGVRSQVDKGGDGKGGPKPSSGGGSKKDN